MSQSEQDPRHDLVAPALLLVALLLLAWPSAAPAQHFANVTVVGVDYAYQVPPTLRAGLTAFSFENHGKVRHELIVARLLEGASLDSLVHSEPGPARLGLVEIIGVLVGDAGSRPLGRLLVDLVPGQTYVLYCNFQDAVGKPRHLAIGMVATVHVH